MTDMSTEASGSHHAGSSDSSEVIRTRYRETENSCWSGRRQTKGSRAGCELSESLRLVVACGKGKHGYLHLEVSPQDEL